MPTERQLADTGRIVNKPHYLALTENSYDWFAEFPDPSQNMLAVTPSGMLWIFDEAGGGIGYLAES